jgi:hypothetical protein
MLRNSFDALDQWVYEDQALTRMLAVLEDSSLHQGAHGRMVKLFVERLAVREAAREYTAEALARVPELSLTAAHLQESVLTNRQDLDRLDALTRGLRPTNINQGQDVDSQIAEMSRRLVPQITEDHLVIFPILENRLDAARRRTILPSASFVLNHCPLHPGAHSRRWYEGLSVVVWLHAVYDYLRSLPVAGIKPHAEVEIVGEGVLRRQKMNSGRFVVSRT